jgi:hypothetical protein
MAIDITNHHIGIALAHHQPQSLSNGNEKQNSNGNTAIATSITALPPIPYMSNQPYHPSYAFLHRHRRPREGTDCISTRARGGFDRVQRTMEVADQLALLATERKVKGILVRWPGNLASAVSDGDCGSDRGNQSLESITRQREFEEGTFHFRSSQTDDRTMVGTTAPAEVFRENIKSEGSMGYMRGRILYVLDKCTAYRGRDETNEPSLGPLLGEATRPFALFDTSVTEQNWIVRDRECASDKNNPYISQARTRVDKYGNSLTELDLWGRCPVYGNQPPPPHHGKYYFSSKEKYSGYRVSSNFLGVRNGDEGGGDGERADKITRSIRMDDNFDSLHDNDLSGMLNQFQGSLSAMHALYDFVDDNLKGRIALPSWALTSTSYPSFRTNNQEPFEQCENVVGYHRAAMSKRSVPGASEDAAALTTSAAPLVRKATIMENDDNHRRNVSTSLVQMPKRKYRGKGKQ